MRFFGNPIFRVLAFCVRDQFCPGRQSDPELIESAAEAADGKAGVVADAAAIDGDVNCAHRIEDGSN